MEQSIHILHLEDEPADVELVQATLEAAGLTCRITRAQTRDEFDKALRQTKYDVILADYSLPMYDGMSALQLAQELCPDVPFIFVSGAMGEDAAIEGLTEGATDYVLKQKLSRLGPAIKRALHEAENRRERKWAEETLKEREKFLSSIVENIPDMIFIKDAKALRFIRFNKAGEKLLGYKREDLIGKNDYDFFPKEQADFFTKMDREVLESGQLYDIPEEPIDTKAGRRILHTKKIPVLNKNGKPAYLLGISEDITDRKQAQQDLELFRNLVDQSNDAIYVITPETGRFLDFNEKACSDLKYTREDILKLKVTDIDAVISDPLTWEAHVKDIRKKTCVILESEHKRKDGSTFPVEVNVKIVKHGEMEYIIAAVRDITERKLADEEKAKLQARLQQAQKMEAIGTLAGGIAHDFNNILFPMVGFAEMALEDIPESSPIRDNLNEILSGTKRARDLVKQILTFSRQADQELKPLKIQLVIREVLKLIRSSLPSTIEIKQYISNQCGLVIADPTQIHQIAMNLITNAYHAMQETGGKLEVTLKEVDLEPEELKGPHMLPGPYVCLTVADTGVGMNKTVLDRIFDPYFTTKEKDKGTGLGLAVVHGIVQSYGGDIRVYSEPGTGTIFYIYLPVIKSKDETLEIESIAPVQKGTERLLLVDDEDQILRMEKQMLERLGYHVTARTSSPDALEEFRATPDKFDLVITDMTMPNMTGIQLSQKLLAIKPDVPILICSGFSEQIDEEKAKALGISGYIMKPLVKSELSKKIREVIDKNN